MQAKRQIDRQIIFFIIGLIYRLSVNNTNSGIDKTSLNKSLFRKPIIDAKRNTLLQIFQNEIIA
jgi:hypothetical protein